MTVDLTGYWKELESFLTLYNDCISSGLPASRLHLHVKTVHLSHLSHYYFGFLVSSQPNQLEVKLIVSFFAASSTLPQYEQSREDPS